MAQKRELVLFSRNFFAEIYGTLGDKVIEAIKGTGVLNMIFKKIRIQLSLRTRVLTN